MPNSPSTQMKLSVPPCTSLTLLRCNQSLSLVKDILVTVLFCLKNAQPNMTVFNRTNKLKK